MDQATVHVDGDQRSIEPHETHLGPPEAIEAVHVRNYDHRDGHSVAVTLLRDGAVAHRERHYLAPGQSVGVSAPLDPADFEVRVRVDGVERERRTCRLDDTAAGTAAVELGNGVVSLTAGAGAVTAAN